MRVRVRFLGCGGFVEPSPQERAGLAGRYISLLANARFGQAYEVSLVQSGDAQEPHIPKRESPA